MLLTTRHHVEYVAYLVVMEDLTTSSLGGTLVCLPVSSHMCPLTHLSRHPSYYTVALEKGTLPAPRAHIHAHLRNLDRRRRDSSEPGLQVVKRHCLVPPAVAGAHYPLLYTCTLPRPHSPPLLRRVCVAYVPGIAAAYEWLDAHGLSAVLAWSVSASPCSNQHASGPLPLSAWPTTLRSMSRAALPPLPRKPMPRHVERGRCWRCWPED